MTGVLCLKWNNHNSTFLQTLHILRTKELYCDATLACCGNYYPVHRFVLTTCSEYFEEIFSRTPCKHPFIVLKDVDDLHLEALLSYMYKGEVNVLREDLPGFIKAAEALRIKGLAVSDEENYSKKQPEKKTHSIQPPQTHPPQAPCEPIISDPFKVESNNDMSNDVQEAEKADADLESPLCAAVPRDSRPTTPLDKTPSIDATPTDNGDVSKNQEECQQFSVQNNDPVDEGMASDVFEEYVKREPEEIEQVEEKFEINNERSSHSFMSLLDSAMFPEKESEDQSDSMNGLAIPQCSAWTDSISNPDSTMSKEALHSSWLPPDYDPFALDPLQSLEGNDASSPATVSSEGNRRSRKDSSGKKWKYVCEECNFNTNDKAAFRLHMMRKHTFEKPFGCSLCSYRCTTKDMLKIHTRKHTGERPFSCPYCTCRMAVKSSLKRHILIKHIQTRKPKSSPPVAGISFGTLKTYKCTDCSYESQMKSNLKLHYMRKHTGEKPFACSLCPYRTTTKPQLEKHMRKHTGEKPFACTFCSYKAAQKHSLLRHMALHTK